MKTFAIGRFGLGVCAITLLAACSTGGSQIAPLGFVQRAPQLSQHVNAKRSSWMKLDGYTGALLYISDPGANVVNVLTYPNGKRIGKLTGFNEPRGECVDRAGNVYVANEGASNILEYAHGGTTPINIIGDPGQQPYDCAANHDPGNLVGTLAVVNASTTSRGHGSVTVYGGRAAGTYNMPRFSSVLFLSYVRRSSYAELWVDGRDKTGHFLVVKLHPHTSGFQLVTLPQTIGAPGAVQWDGKYLAIGDQDGPGGTTLIDRFAIGTNIVFIGSTPLTSSVAQFFIHSSTVIGPYSSAGTVGFWNYPAGGSPTKTFSFFVAPFGSAVSP